jgi:hypothetical protein
MATRTVPSSFLASRRGKLSPDFLRAIALIDLAEGDRRWLVARCLKERWPRVRGGGRWRFLCIATFMLLLDVTVVNVALPGIERDLGASFSYLQWVISA